MKLPSYTLVYVGLLHLWERWSFCLWIGRSSEEQVLALEALTSYHLNPSPETNALALALVLTSNMNTWSMACARSMLASEAFGGHGEQTSVTQNIALEQAAWALGSLGTQEFSLQEVVWGQKLGRGDGYKKLEFRGPMDSSQSKKTGRLTQGQS